MLVEQTILWVEKTKPNEINIVDLGAGSGCVGLSLLQEIPQARLLAIDKSKHALAVAEKNAASLGVSPRVRFYEGDAGAESVKAQALELAGFPQVRVVVANPPYIAQNDGRVEKQVHEFEPHEALYAGGDGMAFLKGWSANWVLAISSPGLMLMEMGLDQGPSLQAFFTNLGLSQVEILKDLSGHDRVIKGVKHG